MRNYKIILLLSLAAYVPGGRTNSDEDDSAPLTQADKPLNENTPIREDKDDEIHDTVITESETPATSPQQDSVRPTYNFTQLIVSRLHPSKIYTTGTKMSMHVNTGVQSRPVYSFGVANNFSLNGHSIIIKDKTLEIGGHQMRGVDATVRPVELIWGEDKLYANEIYQPALDGIQGEGKWSF